MSVRILPFAALMALAVAVSASAHGGSQVYSGEEGPYLTWAFASEVSGVDATSGKEVRYIDYTVALRNTATGWAEDNATVRVTARTESGSIGPVDAQALPTSTRRSSPIPSPTRGR